MSFFVVQGLIDEIVRHCAENGLTEDELNQALMSMLNSSMRAGGRSEHTLSNDDGELLLLVKCEM